MTAPVTRPLAELCELAGRGETGEFICATSVAEVHVYLQRGRVAWATSSDQPFEFARYLKEHHRIDDETFREVVDECRRERLPLGETLVAWELIGWDEVKTALRHQISGAFATLARMTSARTMFLERKAFIRYNVDLTVEIRTVLPELPAAVADRAALGVPAGDAGLARQLAETIEGATWVELLDGARLVEACPARASQGTTARVPAELVRSTIGDDADFVAVRGARGTVIGARLAQAGGSLWCRLGTSSTFGAAVSKLWSLSMVRLHAHDGLRRDVRDEGWEVGDSASSPAGEIRMVLARAREVLAAVVWAPSGEPILGVGRGGIDREQCFELVRRRSRVFAAPACDDDGDDGEHGLDAIGFSMRTIVTGERSVWCFGAERLARREGTLWVLTDRAASQGIGWACLTALARGFA